MTEYRETLSKDNIRCDVFNFDYRNSREYQSMTFKIDGLKKENLELM
jgi:hypothetical protein